MEYKKKVKLKNWILILDEYGNDHERNENFGNQDVVCLPGEE